MTSPKLVLASTSRYRRELLSRLGVPFEAVAPTCDEEALKSNALTPEQNALFLAREKALSVAHAHRDAYVLGSDQLVELDGTQLGKPHTKERAVQQLMQMRGKSHQLLTALCLVGPSGEQVTHLDRHVLTMPRHSEESLRRYVDADLPLDCAGSYKIEARGIALFERIQGDDFTAITGLPLLIVAKLLRERGFVVP